MTINWPAIRRDVGLAWFYARSHFTKALGAAAIVIGYGLEQQAQFVSLLSETRRGTVIKYFGYAAVALGIYNRFFPPKKPETPP